ncbi:MAG: hypothetical protein IT280_09565 [Ignavibacteria bacterium]|nr:hypothetical protein [Ignavibacteria bacterium]
MKNIISAFLFLIVSTLCYSQNNSEYSGIWQSIVKAGNKPTTPTYLQFNADGSCKWGVNQDGTDGTTVTTGKWEITSDGEIKLTTDASPNYSQYYSPTGENMKFIYKYDETNGDKNLVRNTDMTVYLQKQ